MRDRGRFKTGLIVISFSLGFLAVSLNLVSDHAKAGVWFIEQVDPFGNVGYYTSIAIDSVGNPHIGYFDISNEDLKYASWDGISWAIEIVDSLGFVGQDASMALDQNDRPHFGYWDGTNWALKHAWWDGSAWRNETVDSNGVAGTQTSIALDRDNHPHISYRDETSNTLRYAHWNGTGWKTETVDATSDAGYYTSIALDSKGYPHISYGWHPPFNPDGDLKYASWDGNAWSIQTVDASVNTGDWTSLALDASDNPHISYATLTTAPKAYLKYASWNGTTWGIETVDSAGDAGLYTSLVLDGDGHAHISYYDIAGGDLKYAVWTGSSWSIETVDSVNDAGQFTSLAIGADGTEHISYFGVTWRDLMHAYRMPNRPPGTPFPPFGTAAGTVGVQYVYQTMTTDPDKDQVMFTFDWDDSTMSDSAYVDSGTIGSASHAWPVAGVYHARVMATDMYGAASGWSNILTVTITGPPVPPTELAASPGNRLVTLSWTAPSYDGGSPITNYDIYRGTGPGLETFLTEIGNLTSFDDSGLTNGQQYCYQVTAKNANGEGQRSNEACATPATVPVPPANLAAIGGDASVTLTWSPPADDGGSTVTNYRVHRGTTSGGESFLAEIGSTLTYTDTGLTNGQTYYYEVTAKNIAGESPRSNEASATPATTPTEPLNLQASPGDSQIVLTWNVPASNGGSAIANYRISRGTAPGGETFLVEIGNVLTYADTGLANGQTYYYTVRAKNAVGEGPSSNEASAVPAAIPSAPRNLQATAGDAQIALAWGAPLSDGGTPITGYAVYRGNEAGNETLLVLVGEVLSYTDLTVTTGHTYYYKVTAINAVGEGPGSNEVSAATQDILTPPKEEAPWLWLVIVLAIVFVVAAMMLLRRKRRAAETESGKPSQSTHEEQ